MKIQYFLFLALTILIGCSSEIVTPSKNHYFLIDRSDTELVIPDCDEITQLITSEDRYAGNNIYFSIINDNQLNPIHAVYLKPGISGLLGNDHERSNQIALFEEQVCAVLKDIQIEASSYDRSEIFRSVVGMAKHMKKEEQEGRIKIYSDLLEHSNLFCSYCEDEVSRLKQNTDLVAQAFCQSVTIPDNLNGITIVIKHQPKPERAEQFQLMIQLYTQIFESRGAKVKYENINRFQQ